MLLIAGLVEGFVSPSNLPMTMKFLLSAALGTLMVLYFSRKGSPSGGDAIPESAAQTALARPTI